MRHLNNKQTPAARRDDLVVQEMPDEVLVYDLKTHKAHCLNETAAFVWNHCDGKMTVAEMVAFMEKEWGKPVGEDVVWLALKELSRADLLQDRVVTNGDGVRASRRAVLRKLGAAAAMTPLVISILAPSASASASVPVQCQACVKKINTSGNCPAACIGVCGSCFDNSGCGSGQFKGCQSCFSCLDGPSSGGVGTVSWTAPGDQGCGTTTTC
jgi:hypothetical protein